MKLRDVRALLTMGAMLIGLGAYGAIAYAMNRQSFHNAVREFTQRFPDKVAALRSELLSEEGIPLDTPPPDPED